MPRWVSAGESGDLMPANRMKNGDVLLLSNGRLAQIVETKVDWSDLAMVQFIDVEEPSCIDAKRLIEHNLGQAPGVLMSYHSARAIHLRLNRLAKA